MSKKSSGSGSTVLGMLGVLFVGLKLTGVINWSWWWVTAPFWAGAALVLVLFALYAVYTVIKVATDD